MQGSGVRATQFTILSQLMLRGEMPIGKLASFLGMERTTLSRNLTLCWKGRAGFRSTPAKIRARA